MLWSLLDATQRRSLSWLLALMVLSGGMEVVSIVSLGPFLAVAANPDVVKSNQILSAAYTQLGSTTIQSFLITLGFVVLGVLLVSIIANAGISWLQLRLAASINAGLATRLLQHYLAQPYSFFIQRNTAHLQAFVQSEVLNLTSYGLVPLLQVLQKSVGVTLILIAMVWADPVAAVGCVTAFLVFYLAVFFATRRKLRSLGERIGVINRQRYHLVDEAFGMVKLTRLHSLERSCVDRFQPVALESSQALASQNMVSMMPRFALEAIVLTVMMSLLLYLIVTTPNFATAVPIIGFYAFAAYRLMPSIQLIYASVSMIQFGWPRVEEVHAEFQNGEDGFIEMKDLTPSPLLQNDSVLSAISATNLWFTYPSEQEPTIRGVDLTIEPNTTVGFCGQTGAGKSTLVDILVGLLRPQKGEICISGIPLTQATLRRWYRNIGYVPQEIYLLDASIAENVALGTSVDNIDLDRVREACKQANIASFIETLPLSYQSSVGENGTRLSGGQKQRIGIARALYRNPQVVVFDEATSNLDSETEQVVMSAVRELAHSRTILLVAHRLETLRFCDQVIELADGEILRRGTYNEVIRPKIENLTV